MELTMLLVLAKVKVKIEGMEPAQSRGAATLKAVYDHVHVYPNDYEKGSTPGSHYRRLCARSTGTLRLDF